MGHEAGGELAGQPADPRVHAAEPGGRRQGRAVGAGVEVRLQPREPVGGSLIEDLAPRAERLVERLEGLDVLAHPRDRFAPRDAHAVLDVLADLGAETELEPAPGELGEVPCRVGGQGRAADEGQGDARTDGDTSRVLGGENRDGEGVVNRLGDVQTVKPHGLDPSGVDSNRGQRHTGIHPGVDLHDRRSSRIAPPPGSPTNPRCGCGGRPGSTLTRQSRAAGSPWAAPQPTPNTLLHVATRRPDEPLGCGRTAPRSRCAVSDGRCRPTRPSGDDHVHPECKTQVGGNSRDPGSDQPGTRQVPAGVGWSTGCGRGE